MISLLRIRQLYRSLSRNDQKLADFLLHHTEEARHLSSQRVAQMTGVSQSSPRSSATKDLPR